MFSLAINKKKEIQEELERFLATIRKEQQKDILKKFKYLLLPIKNGLRKV
jgi:hypothetical protein